VPFETATGAVHALDLTARCAKKGNVSAISDALSGAAMSRAALTAASYNVRINLYGHPDKPASNMLLENLETLERRADDLEAEIRRAVKDRAKLA
jgi:formiminotetrahydrofolate cyclodeaminase